MKVFYTFGSDSRFPFYGGWVEVTADSMTQAHALFRAYYPDRTPGILNCADYYTEQQFNDTVMPTTGNCGAFCHRKLSAGTGLPALMRQAESEVKKMDWKEESQTEKPSGKKREGYMILWYIWNVYLGFTAGVFWGIVINLMIRKMCL